MNNNSTIRLFGFILITTSIAFTAPAGAFTLRDDPSSVWGGDPSTTAAVNGNVYTVDDLLVQNQTASSLPELGFVIPFVWQKIEDGDQASYLPMEWRNDLNGWYTSNFKCVRRSRRWRNTRSTVTLS